MKIQILGTGCPKCHTLKEHTEQALKEINLDAEIVAIKEIKEIMKFGVMLTPALAIDGTVKVSGRVPGVKEIIAILQSI